MRTYPWLCGMEVNALHSLRAGKELSLYVKMRVSRVHYGDVECWLVVLTFTSRRILATGPAYARGDALSVPGSSWLLCRYVSDNCEATIEINGEIRFNLVAVGSWSCKLVHSLTPPSKHGPPTPAFWVATAPRSLSPLYTKSLLEYIMSRLMLGHILEHDYTFTREYCMASGRFV